MKESAFARKKAIEGTDIVSNVTAPINEFEVLGESRRENTENDALTLRNGETPVETLSKDTVVVRLHGGESIVVLGLFDLVVKTGTVEISGARIVGQKDARVHRIFAPRSHALPVITGLDGPKHGKKIANSVILNSVSGGIRDFDIISDAFHGLWDIGTGDVANAGLKSRPSFSILGHHFQYDKRHRKSLIPFQPNQAWLTAVEKIARRSARKPDFGMKVLICGPKNSGKSTMVKYIANTLLSPIANDPTGWTTSCGVAILDIDPGQPEFGPPGTLSLVHIRSPIFGPSYTHPLDHAAIGTRKDSIIHQHFLASVTPKGLLGTYVEFVLHLLAKYSEIQERYKSCPLIINASGWVTGDGITLFEIIFAAAQLTDVIYMSDMGPPEVISYLTEQCQNGMVDLALVGAQASGPSRAASTLRQMQYLSYFLLNTTPSTNEAQWSLLNESSLTLHYAGTGQEIQGLATFGRRLDEHQVADHFTDQLVGIIALDSLGAISGPKTSSMKVQVPPDHSWAIDRSHIDSVHNGSDPIMINTSREQLPYIITEVNQPVLIDAWKSHCVGLGIIKTIDRHDGTIELRTPIRAEQIERVVNFERKFLVLVDMETVCLDWTNEKRQFLESLTDQG